MPREPLPIDAAFRRCSTPCAAAEAVLRAPTGAGKTTPRSAGLANRRRAPGLSSCSNPVPRRRPSRRAANGDRTRFALGDTFGYQVRFDRQAGPRTRVLVATPGVLLRMLHDDPFLERVGVRRLRRVPRARAGSDLALGMVKLVRETVRPDLRVVVMSATLDPGPVAAYLGDCPWSTARAAASPSRLLPAAAD